jgi:hypothetical protein
LFHRRRFRTGLRHLDRHFARGLATAIGIEAGGYCQAFARGIRIAQCSAKIQVHRFLGATTRDIQTRADVEGIEVHAADAATIEVEVHAHGAATLAFREHLVFGGNLLAHDDDLVPLARLAFAARIAEVAGQAEEFLLVAPDEEHFEQLELEVTSAGLALNGDAHQVRRLVVQAIGHVEIGFGQRIALVQIDRGLAADGFVGADARRQRDVLRFLQGAMRTGFFDQDVVGNARFHRRAHAARVGQGIHRLR